MSGSNSFLRNLLFGLLALVMMTTLSAGMPAYWLTRTHLEAQVWSQVDTIQQATLSLLQAEKDRLKAVAFLLSERPTLHRLLAVQAWDELQLYLQNFRQQSQLDILLYCQANRVLSAGAVGPTRCPTAPTARFELVAGRPALLVSQRVYNKEDETPVGIVVVGLWLNEGYLRQLAANTGGEQSLLLPNGDRLVSSFAATPVASSPETMLQTNREQLTLPEGRYYAAYFPLTGTDDQMVLISEVALAIDGLIATERRALWVLAISTSLVALGGLVLGAWYIRSLTAPLHHLTRVSKQISAGNFTTPIPTLSGPSEVATLTVALKQSQSAMLRALAEQSHTKEWLNTLLQSIVEGVVTFDTQRQITFFTQGAESLTDWPAEEALGQSVNQVFCLAEADGTRFTDRLPLAGDKQVVEIVTRAGKRVVLAVTGAGLIPPHTDTAQMALVLRDVTEEDAQQRLRSYFLANMSHEFRTPLSALNASLELLLDELDQLKPEEMRTLLNSTHLSLLNLQTLIENLLESSRIEAGQFIVRRQPVDLNQVLTQALHIVNPLLQRQQQALTLTEPGHLLAIQGDASRLTQVMVNLLINASKYSSPGQTIDIQLAQSNQHLRVSVLDRGPGIPPAERLNLFRRFVRLDSAQHEQYGIGLGLHVVKTTVEAHGGRVGVEARPGGGSIFWFELPITPAVGAS